MDCIKSTNCVFYQALFLCWLISISLVFLKNTAIEKISRKLSMERGRRINRKIFCSVYKVISYSFIVFYGYTVLNNTFWIRDRHSYALLEPPQAMPLKLTLYYVYELSFYFIEIQSLLLHYELNDRNQMLFHHIVTLLLILGSFLLGYTRYGLVVMAIHDIADPFLESAKLFVYLKDQFLADVVFTVFTLVFVVSRLLLYPYLIVFPVFIAYSATRRIEYLFFGVLLSLLLVMHLIWFVMICRVARNIVRNHELKDVRSNSVDPTIRSQMDN